MTERGDAIEGEGRDEHEETLSADAGDAGDLDTPDEGLLSQLALIDDQPLGDRAAAFAQLHDALRQQLEA